MIQTKLFDGIGSFDKAVGSFLAQKLSQLKYGGFTLREIYVQLARGDETSAHGDYPRAG